MSSLKYFILFISISLFISNAIAQQNNQTNENDFEYERFWSEREANFDPVNGDYWIDLLLFALVGAILGIVCCFVGMCYCCARWCCHCKPCVRHDIGQDDENKPIFSTVFFQIGFILICVVAAFAVIVGLYSNVYFSYGIGNLVETVSNTTIEVNSTIVFVQTKLASLRTQSLTLPVEVVEIGTTVVETTQQIKEIVYTVDAVRDLLVMFGFQFCLLTLALGFATGCLRTSFLSIGLLVMGFFSLFFMWWAFAFNLPISMLFDDVCIAASNFLKDENGQASDYGFGVLIECLANGSYSPIVADLTTSIESLYFTVNVTMYGAVQQSLVPLPNYDNETPETKLRLLLNATNSNFKTHIVDRNITFVGLSDYFSDFNVFLAVAESIIALVGCDHVSVLVFNVYSGVCNVMSVSFYGINITNLLLCICLSFLTAIAIFSSSTFPKWPEEKFKYACRAMMIIVLVTGIVGILTVGNDQYEALAVALCHILVSIIGLLLLWRHFRTTLVLLFILQSFAVVFYVIMIAILAYQLNECVESSECNSADLVGWIDGLIYLLISVIPDFVCLILLAFALREEIRERRYTFHSIELNEKPKQAMAQGQTPIENKKSDNSIKKLNERTKENN